MASGCMWESENIVIVRKQTYSKLTTLGVLVLIIYYLSKLTLPQCGCLHKSDKKPLSHIKYTLTWMALVVVFLPLTSEPY